MHLGPISYALLAGLAIALLIAAATDLRRREIDNGLTAAIALGAPLFWLASGVGAGAVGMQVLAALVAFAVLAGLFALGAIGGGDVKLLAALALWLAPAAFLRVVVLTALIGGPLSLACVALHVARRRRGTERMPVAVPYGVAIAAAGLCVLGPAAAPAGAVLATW